MITIAVINEKGGVGKTTTAINLAAGLSRHGFRVLALDLDPQANTTAGLGVNWMEYRGKGVGDALLVENPDLTPFIVTLDRSLPDLVPATRDLRAIAHELVEQGGPINRLDQAMTHLDLDYDYGVLDLPPTLEILQENAIQSANRFLIPIELSAFSLDGLTELVKHLHHRKSGRSDWQFRILPSRVEGFNRETNAAIREDLGPLAQFLSSSRIRFNGKIPMSQREGKDIYSYAPRSRGARDFRALTQEIITLWPAPTPQTW
ncbi:ParA family protein [Candidatus Sumerlaeota bacterium]|nr:ParA family protein [Candidatus Sumerlaeota bacterium]